jgi:hypothetical protein
MRIDRDAVATATLPISTWAETIGDDGTATTWIRTFDGWYSTLADDETSDHLPAGGVRIVGIPMTVCEIPALDGMEVRYADETDESDAVFAALGGPFYDEGEHLLALLGSAPEGVGFVTPQGWVIAPCEVSYGVEVGVLAWMQPDDDEDGPPVRVVQMPADVLVVS